MKSRRHLVVGVCGLALLFVIITLMISQSADAARRFSARSLVGAYHFSVIEIRQGAPPVYCNAYGIIAFDGAGGAILDDDWGYGSCTDGDNPIADGTFAYEVLSDGSVTLTELNTGHGYVTHCQILNRGQLLLCDGTGGGPGAVVSPDQLLWMATAGKM